MVFVRHLSFFYKFFIPRLLFDWDLKQQGKSVIFYNDGALGVVKKDSINNDDNNNMGTWWW